MTKIDKQFQHIREHIENTDWREQSTVAVTTVVLIDIQLRTVAALERLVTLLENKTDPHSGVEG